MSVSLINGHIDDDVMTDTEIVKALECCKAKYGLNNQCDKCCFHGMYCMDKLVVNALDLINRQKAEIKRLERIKETIAILAIKEFAERVKQKTLAMVFSPDVLSFEDYCECIDNLVKEMVGAESG